MQGFDPAESGESSSRVSGRRLVLVALALLGACGAPPRQPAPAAPAPPVAVAAPTGPAYRIDPERSELRILVYRAGALARFGHNHVLVSRALGGEVRVAAPGVVVGGTFDVSLAVASFAVDEPVARHEEGAEFSTEPSAADVEGTRRNLLGPGVLDAAAFPTLRVHGVTGGTATGPSAQATVELRGRSTPLTVPLTVTDAGSTLTVRGGFGVLQSALGLTPFSAALGALAVRDEIEVRFRIVAVRGG
jgi:hypothetical protein